MKKNIPELIFLSLTTFITSYFFNLLLRPKSTETILLIKIFCVAAMVIISLKFKRKILKFSITALTLTFIQYIQYITENSYFWKHSINFNRFNENFGSQIILKFLSSAVIIFVMLIIFRKPGNFYFTPGNIKTKASEIKIFGIPDKKISWLKLSVISGILISAGTVLLTFLTVNNLFRTIRISFFIKEIPFILIFAIVNSFSENILFRNAIMGPLINSGKSFPIILSALYFGSFHYNGVPSGILGIIAAAFLGWYISESMYETKGFLSSWIIHFFQDFAIFSVIVLTGNFY